MRHEGFFFFLINVFKDFYKKKFNFEEKYLCTCMPCLNLFFYMFKKKKVNKLKPIRCLLVTVLQFEQHICIFENALQVTV